MDKKRNGMVATVAILALGVFASAASANAQLRNTVTNAAIPGGTAVKLRSSANMTLAFNNGGGPGSGGTVTCRHPYAALGDATVTTNTITGLATTSTWTGVGSISSLIFGDQMPVTQTTAGQCNTSIPGISSCAFQLSNAPVTIDAQINNASSPDQGINARVYKAVSATSPPVFTPVQVSASCVPSGSTTPINCVYKGGTNSSNPTSTNANASYNTSAPIKADTLTFSNQPFYRDTAASAGLCPATGSGTTTPALFNGSFQLFTTGGQQIAAFKVSEK